MLRRLITLLIMLSIAGALAWALWWLPAVAPLRRFAGLARWRQRVFGPLPIRS